MDKAQIIALIPTYATKYNVSPKLVEAVIATESSFRPYACRFEAGYRWTSDVAVWAQRLGQTEITEQMHQKMSWGLMQLMGALARELGHKTYIPEICDPHVGLELGCKHLSLLQKRYQSIGDVVAAYNAGSPRKNDLTGAYENQSYVDKVLSKMV